MRCCCGGVMNDDPPPDLALPPVAVQDPPPVIQPAPDPELEPEPEPDDDLPDLPEIADPPPPAQMSPPYYHETPSDTTGVVYGPLRNERDEDVEACAQDRARREDDQVRDVYLRFAFVQARPDDRAPGNAADEDAARDLAVAVVQHVRTLLPNGPFNNRIHLPEAIAQRRVHPRTEDARADFIYLDAVDAIDPEDRAALGPPERLFDVDGAMENMPGGLVRGLASMAASTLYLGGGVCEKFSSVVMGVLSTCAPPGTVACKVAWSGDHHFVVLRIGTSQWWVVDPWPHNAYVLPWSECYFAQGDIVQHTAMTVVAPVADSYGVRFDDDAIAASHARSVAIAPFTHNDGAFDHNWGQRDNLGAGVVADGVGVVLAANEDDWG